MKQLRWLVVGVALAGPGCLGLPLTQEAPKPPPPMPVAHFDPPAPPPVLPEQINEQNGRVMAGALARELDHAAAQGRTPDTDLPPGQ